MNDSTHSELNHEKLTLWHILGSMPVGQLWGFVGVVLGLIVGAGYLAWTVRGMVEESNRKLAEIDHRELKSKLDALTIEQARAEEKLSQLKDKEHYLSLYYRYEQVLKGDDTSMTKEEAAKALSDYVLAKLGLKRLALKKGSNRLAIVEFPDDTRFTVPRALHAAAEE